ncbi:hypothetical protein PCE1_002715 [Barthelona sp. PCE]
MNTVKLESTIAQAKTSIELEAPKQAISVLSDFLNTRNNYNEVNMDLLREAVSILADLCVKTKTLNNIKQCFNTFRTRVQSSAMERTFNACVTDFWTLANNTFKGFQEYIAGANQEYVAALKHLNPSFLLKFSLERSEEEVTELQELEEVVNYANRFYFEAARISFEALRFTPSWEEKYSEIVLEAVNHLIENRNGNHLKKTLKAIHTHCDCMIAYLTPAEGEKCKSGFKDTKSKLVHFELRSKIFSLLANSCYGGYLTDMKLDLLTDIVKLERLIAGDDITVLKTDERVKDHLERICSFLLDQDLPYLHCRFILKLLEFATTPEDLTRYINHFVVVLSCAPTQTDHLLKLGKTALSDCTHSRLESLQLQRYSSLLHQLLPGESTPSFQSLRKMLLDQHPAYYSCISPVVAELFNVISLKQTVAVKPLMSLETRLIEFLGEFNGPFSVEPVVKLVRNTMLVRKSISTTTIHKTSSLDKSGLDVSKKNIGVLQRLARKQVLNTKLDLRTKTIKPTRQPDTLIGKPFGLIRRFKREAYRNGSEHTLYVDDLRETVRMEQEKTRERYLISVERHERLVTQRQERMQQKMSVEERIRFNQEQKRKQQLALEQERKDLAFKKKAEEEAEKEKLLKNLTLLSGENNVVGTAMIKKLTVTDLKEKVDAEQKKLRKDASKKTKKIQHYVANVSAFDKALKESVVPDLHALHEQSIEEEMVKHEQRKERIKTNHHRHFEVCTRIKSDIEPLLPLLAPFIDEQRDNYSVIHQEKIDAQQDHLNGLRHSIRRDNHSKILSALSSLREKLKLDEARRRSEADRKERDRQREAEISQSREQSKAYSASDLLAMSRQKKSSKKNKDEPVQQERPTERVAPMDRPVGSVDMPERKSNATTTRKVKKLTMKMMKQLKAKKAQRITQEQSEEPAAQSQPESKVVQFDVSGSKRERERPRRREDRPRRYEERPREDRRREETQFTEPPKRTTGAKKTGMTKAEMLAAKRRRK